MLSSGIATATIFKMVSQMFKAHSTVKDVRNPSNLNALSNKKHCFNSRQWIFFDSAFSLYFANGHLISPIDNGINV